MAIVRASPGKGVQTVVPHRNGAVTASASLYDMAVPERTVGQGHDARKEGRSSSIEAARESPYGCRLMTASPPHMDRLLDR